jgi:hypothetical protein
MAFTGDMPQQAANSGALQCEDWVSDMLLPKESSHGFRTEISTSFMLDPLPGMYVSVFWFHGLFSFGSGCD